jgi:hypothetical protein
MKHLISDHAERLLLLERERDSHSGVLRQSTVAQVTNVSWYDDGRDDRNKRSRLDSYS